MNNEAITRWLRQQANALAAQRENLYRVRSYCWAASVVEALEVEVGDLVRTQGRKALEQLPGIGRSLARRIIQLLKESSALSPDTGTMARPPRNFSRGG